jgi:hypothetical protein
MKPVGNETIRKQLRWRYAATKFDAARTIPPADRQAPVLAPSSPTRRRRKPGGVIEHVTARASPGRK